uniref:Uncharacterized protein n=1 Tax=Glossina brevipalpis TaxID=37001 RepID=A0A1A9WSJ9_9MUSC
MSLLLITIFLYWRRLCNKLQNLLDSPSESRMEFRISIFTESNAEEMSRKHAMRRNNSVHILIPDAVPSTAPVMANSPVTPVDLVDLSSPNPLGSRSHFDIGSCEEKLFLFRLLLPKVGLPVGNAKQSYLAVVYKDLVANVLANPTTDIMWPRFSHNI